MRAVAEVQRLPYAWPAPPDARSAASTGQGSCASKHALLAERLGAMGVSSRPLLVVGRLVPDLLADDPVISAGVGLPEVHELLTVSMPGVGPLLVDVTWDPPLVDRGLAGTLRWDGASDMALAVASSGPGWVPDPDRVREEKEALRARVYAGGERALRDHVLAAMSARFAVWRANARTTVTS